MKMNDSVCLREQYPQVIVLVILIFYKCEK